MIQAIPALLKKSRAVPVIVPTTGEVVPPEEPIFYPP
jgi:hypothetical protein